MTIKTTQLNQLKEEVSKCKGCLLCETRNNIVFSDGCENAPIMFIGEAPGKNEDEQGLPFVGRAGKLLRKYLEEVGYLKENFYIANTLKCRPPENRKPTKEEKLACEKFLLKQIEIVNPKIVVLVGATALESFIKTKITITKARGEIFEINKKLFVPVFHPSYLLRFHNEKENSPRYLFRKDLEKILLLARENES